jgi:hypothetical protein
MRLGFIHRQSCKDAGDLLRAVQAAVFPTPGPSAYSAFNINELKEMRSKMKLFKVFASVLCLLVIWTLSAPPARADQWNKETKVTFSAPVEVPGTGAQILPAGTYVFQLVDSGSNRNIVRISSADKNHVYTTILAIPNYRLQPTDETVMTFKERAAGQPEALRAWFYPGNNFGQEFVYRKSRAVELAKIVNEPVLATPIELAAAPIEVLKTAPVEAIKPTGEVVELAQVVEPPPVTAERLPQTASPLPLIGLLGMLSLGAGFAFSLIQKRLA